MPTPIPGSVPVVSPNEDAIVRLAAEESTAWAESLFARLENDGRPIQGGWPGTISEARRRLMTRLSENPQDALVDRGDLDRLVDLIYTQAKQHWLRVSRG